MSVIIMVMVLRRSLMTSNDRSLPPSIVHASADVHRRRRRICAYGTRGREDNIHESSDGDDDRNSFAHREIHDRSSSEGCLRDVYARDVPLLALIVIILQPLSSAKMFASQTCKWNDELCVQEKKYAEEGHRDDACT